MLEKLDFTMHKLEKMLEIVIVISFNKLHHSVKQNNL
jgi:hypothetical protein